MEVCPCIEDEEHYEQTHPVPTICRGRRGRGKYPSPKDRERPDGTQCAKKCIHQDARHLICVLVQQKKDAERAHKKMSAREEAAFKWKMAESDEAGVDDGQSPPPSLTSV